MKDSRIAYIIVIAVSLFAVYETKQWLNAQKAKHIIEQPPAQEEYVFDPETYVDPYGITTCYPSDSERIRRERAKNAIHSPTQSKGKYHYRITVSNLHRDRRRHSSDLSYLNGTYEWDMDLYITDQDELLSYIINNYDVLKRYKVASDASNIYDIYNDNYDDYRDDPEDEITYDPDIYNFLDD